MLHAGASAKHTSHAGFSLGGGPPALACPEISADHQHKSGYKQKGALCTLAYDYCLLPARYTVPKASGIMRHSKPRLPMKWGTLCTDRGANTRCAMLLR